MEELFATILDQDEKIIKTFKPNKLKLYFSNILLATIFSLFVCGFMCIGMYSDEIQWWLPLVITLGVLVIIIACTCLFVHLYYKNVFFAYSNKRIIIRTGIFGVDYKSLDMKMIGAVDVYVSLVDKILHKNTGTITFGSTASPINANVSNYKFTHVVAPYEIYKEVKNVIDEFKKTN